MYEWIESTFGLGDGLARSISFVVSLAMVLGLVAIFFFILKKLAGGRINPIRGRQPRIAVTDSATVDTRRRLVLVRRDNVEHLILIGGPTDVVVEQGITRGKTTGTPPAPSAPGPRLDEGDVPPPRPSAENRLASAPKAAAPKMQDRVADVPAAAAAPRTPPANQSQPAPEPSPKTPSAPAAPRPPVQNSKPAAALGPAIDTSLPKKATVETAKAEPRTSSASEPGKKDFVTSFADSVARPTGSRTKSQAASPRQVTPPASGPASRVRTALFSGKGQETRSEPSFSSSSDQIPADVYGDDQTMSPVLKADIVPPVSSGSAPPIAAPFKPSPHAQTSPSVSHVTNTEDKPPRQAATALKDGHTAPEANLVMTPKVSGPDQTLPVDDRNPIEDEMAKLLGEFHGPKK
ncbi:flagellar biosynthetic protein FliO [Roseibium sp. RKSG952]|uniref:flagellar biosynthetic protein FliO n=1 Tax=Roseibium sp. RKSG952 TaxID=2529384 RepID=UPI0012BD67E1|nr:flagellar biosynthetic protein FliO [Roseibium sp. RKSG952]MTH97632.1 hypothetical protein [Roseibium sp. RKSG952]